MAQFNPGDKLHIIDLQIDNFKGIVSATISANDKNVVEITGKNGSGKTSALDAIFAALQWAQASKLITNPVRVGGDANAKAVVNIGKYIVTRKWKRGEGGETTTSLEVKTHDGLKISPPQKVLDELVGDLSFDPSAFTRLKPQEQAAKLLDTFGLSGQLREIDNKYKQAYDTRRDLNRDAQALTTNIKALGDVTAATPRELTSATDITTELSQAHADNGKRETADRALVHAERQYAAAKEALSNAEHVLALAKDDANKAPQFVDTGKIKERLLGVEQANVDARNALQYDRLTGDLGALNSKIELLNAMMADCDARKAELSAALPLNVEGLAVTSDGLTLRGVALSDCSTAEKWRVSIAIAMASNPALRVLRIADGSLLDQETREFVAEVAAANDYQVWIETVESQGGDAIVIVNGETAGA